MFINSLRTTSFRNLADEEIFTGAKDVFLVGENGQGKTNFIEALYFCAYASSFRMVNDSDLSQTGQNNFSAEIKIKESTNDSILVKVEKNKKIIFLNGKLAEDRKAILSVVPTIVFCHEDMEFVRGSPERRRWFFDQTLSLYDPVYLEDFRRYRRLLKSRNAVLKDNLQNKLPDKIEPILDAIDPQLAMYGQNIMEKREKAINQFSEILNPLYEEVSGIKGITVQYNKLWKEKDPFSILLERRTADISSGITLSGPHRDRYVFMQDGTEFSGKASTGQRRLLVLLLRVAQSRCFSEMTGINPILLLDDVLLEMDGEKRRRFISVLPDYDQAFFTFLPEEPYRHYCKEDTLVYRVNLGELSKEDF